MNFKALSYKYLWTVLFVAGLNACHRGDLNNTHRSFNANGPTRDYDSILNLMPSALIVSRDHLRAEVTGFPDEILNGISTTSIDFMGFDKIIHNGTIDVAIGLREEVDMIFNELLAASFPIDKMITMDFYGWSDSLSMADNNTSGFNYRVVSGSTVLSLHAYGRAIDINPMQNPYIFHGKTEPSGAVYDPEVKGTITGNSVVVTIFKKYGWKWGGDWKYVKDFQHFYKEF